MMKYTSNIIEYTCITYKDSEWDLYLTDFLRNPPHLVLVPGDQCHVAAPPAELPGKLLPDPLRAPSDD